MLILSFPLLYLKKAEPRSPASIEYLWGGVRGRCHVALSKSPTLVRCACGKRGGNCRCKDTILSLNCQMLLEKTYEISCIFEKNFLPLQPRKESVCRMPRCACQHSKKITASSDGMPLPEFVFYVQSKTTKDAKHLGLTSFDFLPSNDG